MSGRSIRADFNFSSHRGSSRGVFAGIVEIAVVGLPWSRAWV